MGKEVFQGSATQGNQNVEARNQRVEQGGSMSGTTSQWPGQFKGISRLEFYPNQYVNSVSAIP
jgi:hypothetical protein